MTTSIVAQAAFEFVTLNGKDNYVAIIELLKQSGITGSAHDSIIGACCDLEQAAFHTGFVMAECVQRMPLMVGGE